MSTKDIIAIVIFVVLFIIIVLINAIIVKLQAAEYKKKYMTISKESKDNTDELTYDNIIYIGDYVGKSKKSR